ncbi:mitofusin [Massospora cicadina]|nr:mitofusin [Massospora cicadina]
MAFLRPPSLSRDNSFSSYLSANAANPRVGASPPSLHSHASILSGARLASEPLRDPISFEQRERIFQDKSGRLLAHLSETRALVDQLGKLNASEWAFRYPAQPSNVTRRCPRSFQATHATDASDTLAPSTIGRPRSNSVNLTDSNADYFQEVRAFNGRAADQVSELDILRLDVKLGNHADQRVMDSLEKHSISNLIEGRLSHCRSYLDKLAARVRDKNSKILVTGDLNSGKSTFVNALLKRKVLPTDQQPCTMLFCEVLATELNDGFEEAHAIPLASRYNRFDPSTFDRVELRHLSKTVAEEFKGYELVKVYCHDRHATETMLNNGTLDITLIDSPGLNRDSLKTTQLFARQEEIDVVVFVVHAENQFTLSSQEFLQSAGKEKAYIFIVINRFDTIRDKRRAFPRTYDDADELVHFVAAEECFPTDGDHALPSAEVPPDFQRLEGSLRSFILEKRARSKLAPAKLFALNLLADISTLAKFNLDAANKQHAEIASTLELILPQYETTLEEKKRAEAESSDVFHRAVEYSRAEVERSLATFISNMGESVAIPAWPGIFGAMAYVEALKRSIHCSLRQRAGDAERRVAETCASAYQTILRLGEVTEGVPPCPLTKLLEGDALSGIQLSWAEIFDVPSKLRNLSLGFSALTLAGAQVVGTRRLAMLALEVVSPTPSGSSQLLLLAAASFAGKVDPLPLTALGFSFLYLGLGDLRASCTRKVLQRAQGALRAARVPEKAGERAGANAHQYLQAATGHLYAAYCAKLKAQEAVKLAHLELQRVVYGAQAGFSALARDSHALASKLAAISTEDGL